ncbi:MAG: prolyl oligopeptidase family serine peptidase [Deltaproteobacteria bacterium]|nr:prolyl oligopeptidase family serine peptidase [Deltaproteobacteria bacterium]
MSRRRDALAVTACVLSLSCTRATPTAPRALPVASAAPAPSSSAPPPPPASNVVGASFGRPVEVLVPVGYRKGTPAPLVIMLHAYGVNGTLEELFFRLRPHAHARGFLYVRPDGTANGDGRPYWNATDACCAPEIAKGLPTTPDDDVYLIGLLDEIAAKWDVDPKRVFLVGHSNGGFMAHRLACEHADRFAAIVSVAGATFADAGRCKPSSPIAVLQIHGTEDTTIRFGGGAFFGRSYPSARATAERWATLDGCDAKPTSGANLDVDGSVDGLETAVTRWAGCRPNAAVELWTIEGGSHVPLPTTELARGLLDFLFDHPKP